MAIQGNSREFIMRPSIKSRFDGPNGPASVVLECGCFVAAIGSLRMETIFLEFARTPELSGSMMWEDQVITTCGLPISQAQLFVAKAHYNRWILATTQGEPGNWLGKNC
jgi:hypothetical protein